MSAVVIRPLRLAVALAPLALLIPACGGGSEDGDWIAQYRGEPNHDDARLEGSLVREGTCLYSEFTPQGAGEPSRTLLVFPDAVSWDEQTQTLSLDGVGIAIGELGAWGGSEWTGRLASIDWAMEPAADCDLTSVWGVGSVSGP